MTSDSPIPTVLQQLHSTNTSSLNSSIYNKTYGSIWRDNYLSYSDGRIYISDKCKFIYFTTLKTASKTTRQMIDIKQCGFGVNLYKNGGYFKSCGHHKCNNLDVNKMSNTSNDYVKMIFVRHPIARFESLYNYLEIKNREAKAINSSFNKMRINYPNATIQELGFLLFTQWLYDIIMNGKWRTKYLNHMLMMHLRPLSLTPCLSKNKIDNMKDMDDTDIKCFIPSFVSQIERLQDDIQWIQDHDILGANTEKHFMRLRDASHVTETKRVERGISYKYKNALFQICQMYWNDFYCGHYQVPIECEQENDKVWHLVKHCMDLNDKLISWPKPIHYYKPLQQVKR